MKYFKLFLIAIVALVVTSCKDEDSWNTQGDVYVEMAQSEFFTKEGRRIARVPFKVIGDANGLIKVNFKVEEAGTDYPESATDDIHYYVTTKTVNIDKTEKEGYFEFTIVNDRVINDPRSFIVTIESVEGALIGQQSQCVVSIRDNDDDPYDRLGGEWTMTYTDLDQVQHSLIVSIEPALEEDFMYHLVLPMKGAYLSGDSTIMLRYVTNSQNKGVAVGITGGNVLLTSTFGNINTSDGPQPLGKCDVITAFMASGGLTEKGMVEGTWNNDFTEVVFDGTVYMGVRTTQDNDGYFGANALITYMDAWDNIKLTFLRDIN